jgi:hypothetical protein
MKGEELQVLDRALLQDAFYCSVPYLKLEVPLSLYHGSFEGFFVFIVADGTDYWR